MGWWTDGYWLFFVILQHEKKIVLHFLWYFSGALWVTSLTCTVAIFLLSSCVFFLGSYPGGTFPAECFFRAGVGRGAGLPSGTSRRRRHSYFGWTVFKWDFVVNLPRVSYFNRAGIISDLLSFDLAIVGGFLSLHAGPNWVATLNAGKGGAHASYYHRANKQVQPHIV